MAGNITGIRLLTSVWAEQYSTLFAPGKSWDNVRSTTAPYTESRLTRSVANERVGFPVVEHPV